MNSCSGSCLLPKEYDENLRHNKEVNDIYLWKVYLYIHLQTERLTLLADLSRQLPGSVILLIQRNSLLSYVRRVQLRILWRNLSTHFDNTEVNVLAKGFMQSQYHVLLASLGHGQ